MMNTLSSTLTGAAITVGQDGLNEWEKQDLHVPSPKRDVLQTTWLAKAFFAD
jgi:hypothetical protein